MGEYDTEPPMAFSWNELGAELGARRRRLRQAVKPWRAALAEFTVLSGLTLGLAGPAFLGFGAVDWRLGFIPVTALVLGYVWLDARRQAAVRAGVSVNDDRAAAALVAAAALAGFGLYYASNLIGRPPPPPPPAETIVPAEPPAKTFGADIVE